ncbi:lipase family protein [Streptococcus suis]
MTIQDSGYKKFAEEVYNVEPSKAKSNDTPVIVKDSKIEDPMTGQQYKVIAVQDNNNDVDKTNDNGMQAMAVAPYVNGKADTSQIVIAYAGTNFADIRDVDTDIQTVIFGSKDTLVQGNVQQGELPRFTDSQLISAQKFYDDIKKQYPDALLTTTGHSLGAYIALVIGAENRVPATTFNGPDPIRVMSEAAIEWVKANNQMYNNYRIRYDVIGNAGAYFNEIFGTDELEISRNVTIKDKLGLLQKLYSLDPKDRFEIILQLHGLDAYPINEKGQIVDSKGNVVGSEYLTSNAYKHLLSSAGGIVSFRILQTQWSGGGINSDEELFLDVAQSYVIGKSMAGAAKAGLDELTSLKTKADAEVESIWSKVDFSIYSELSAWEVRDIFASHGVTHQEIVSDFHDYTQKKVKKMEKLSTAFDTLKTKLDEAVESKKALDGKLAGEFSAWHESL